MAKDDDDQPGGGVPSRRPDLRRRIAVGAIGAAAVLGVGAYAITSHLAGQDSPALRDTGALAPMVSAGPMVSSAADASASPSVSALGSPSGGASASSASATPSRPASRAPIDPAVQKKIDEAQAAAARAGHPVAKALPPPRKVLSASAVSTRVKQTKDSYLRVTTARADLTNQKDQRMAADLGTKIGNVNCTQRFHFASNVKPKVIPNMMVCWRVSASRSVVTLGVTYKGKPSMSAYVDVIAREWAKLR